MSSPRIERLEDAWRRLGVFERLDEAFEGVGFTADYGTPLPRPDAGRPKVIKDGVWGMIEVDAASMRLLDSPLMQRMRWIKQLGLSYLTYPSAEHSRFAHSLGMFCVVSRFLDVVRRQAGTSGAPHEPFDAWTPSDDYVRLLKHAAIVHDVGHMPFSHVTETAMQVDERAFRCGRATVEDFLFAASDALEKSPKLAECLSMAVVLSPRFRAFYRARVHPGAAADDPVKLAALIAGVDPEPGLAGLANVISGTSIDADKIDYIQRDANACGIPVGVDVSRLFLRSAFLRVTPSELQRLRSSPRPPSTSEVVFVVNASGLDSVEEVGQGRTTLYHRVYLHQTTRNAERLFGRALRGAALSASPAPALSDALTVWAMSDSALLAGLAAHPDPEASVPAARVASRRLPKRACAFGRNLCRLLTPVDHVFPGMSAEERKRLAKQLVGSGLERLRANQLRGDAQRRLEAEVLDEARRLAALLSGGGWVAPADPLEFVAVLPMNNVEASRGECIVLENDQLGSTSATLVSDEQMEATDIVKSAGYVMCDEDWREVVLVAARTVLYARRMPLADVEFMPHPSVRWVVKSEGRIDLDVAAVVRRVGLDRSRVRAVMREADRRGYFDAFPRLAPAAYEQAKVDAVVAAFAPFEGQGGWRVTDAGVRAFVDQVPPSHRPALLDLLGGVDVLGRSRLAELVTAALAKVPATTGSARFLVGFSPDSGSHVRTLVENELSATMTKGGWRFAKSLREALGEAEPDDTLVLVDDNATSGSQAVCQFLAWLGVDEASWTDEQRRERGIDRARLSTRDRATLTSLRLSFATALGTPAAAAHLVDRLPALGLTKFDGLVYGGEMGTSISIPDSLRDLLADVGASVLAWTRHGARDMAALEPTEAEACRRDALGYSGAEALACTVSNVPVGSLTALWCPGFYRGEPWTPLAIRRGYLEKLILA